MIKYLPAGSLEASHLAPGGWLEHNPIKWENGLCFCETATVCQWLDGNATRRGWQNTTHHILLGFYCSHLLYLFFRKQRTKIYGGVNNIVSNGRRRCWCCALQIYITPDEIANLATEVELVIWNDLSNINLLFSHLFYLLSFALLRPDDDVA